MQVTSVCPSDVMMWTTRAVLVTWQGHSTQGNRKESTIVNTYLLYIHLVVDQTWGPFVWHNPQVTFHGQLHGVLHYWNSISDRTVVDVRVASLQGAESQERLFVEPSSNFYVFFYECAGYIFWQLLAIFGPGEVDSRLTETHTHQDQTFTHCYHWVVADDGHF